jgi:hypothetical protein
METFSVAARVVTAAHSLEDHSFHIWLSMYHSILTKFVLFAARRSCLLLVEISKSRTSSSWQRRRVLKTIGSESIIHTHACLVRDQRRRC